MMMVPTNSGDKKRRKKKCPTRSPHGLTHTHTPEQRKRYRERIEEEAINLQKYSANLKTLNNLIVVTRIDWNFLWFHSNFYGFCCLTNSLFISFFVSLSLRIFHVCGVASGTHIPIEFNRRLFFLFFSSFSVLIWMLSV